VHVTSLCIPYFRDNTAIWLPRILDADLARLDEAFGAQPSALMAFAFLKLPLLGTASLIVYSSSSFPSRSSPPFNGSAKRRMSFPYCRLL
jgi:hypothetical protein